MTKNISLKVLESILVLFLGIYFFASPRGVYANTQVSSLPPYKLVSVSGPADVPVATPDYQAYQECYQLQISTGASPAQAAANCPEIKLPTVTMYFFDTGRSPGDPDLQANGGNNVYPAVPIGNSVVIYAQICTGVDPYLPPTGPGYNYLQLVGSADVRWNYFYNVYPAYLWQGGWALYGTYDLYNERLGSSCAYYEITPIGTPLPAVSNNYTFYGVDGGGGVGTIYGPAGAPTPTPAPLPDLTATAGGPSTGQAGIPMSFSGSINNSGPGTAPSSTAGVGIWKGTCGSVGGTGQWVYGPVNLPQAIPSLNPGGSASITSQVQNMWTPSLTDQGQSFCFVVAADFPNGIQETNDNNNVAGHDFYINIQAPTPTPTTLGPTPTTACPPTRTPTPTIASLAPALYQIVAPGSDSGPFPTRSGPSYHNPQEFYLYVTPGSRTVTYFKLAFDNGGPTLVYNNGNGNDQNSGGPSISVPGATVSPLGTGTASDGNVYAHWQVTFGTAIGNRNMNITAEAQDSAGTGATGGPALPIRPAFQPRAATSSTNPC